MKRYRPPVGVAGFDPNSAIARSLLLKPFDCDQHATMVAGWCRDRGLREAVVDMLPPNGFIVEDVACGFLMQSDTPIAFLEGLLANPQAAAEARDAAMFKILAAIFDLAREKGFREVHGYTARPEIVERCRELGMVERPKRYICGVIKL